MWRIQPKPVSHIDRFDSKRVAINPNISPGRFKKNIHHWFINKIPEISCENLSLLDFSSDRVKYSG
jgi:hypothetical protein